MDKITKTPWIRSTGYDLAFILSPPFICLALILLFPAVFQEKELNNEWLWFFLIVCIDVGHVYSTIYRTYFDKETISKNKTLFYLSPLIIYITGVVLYSLNPVFFWRAMAYLAVFHFIRQQYGFLRLYTRKEENRIEKRIDSFVIYASTICPIAYWHFEGKQVFNWFIENDFMYLNIPGALPLLNIVYVVTMAAYVIKEAFFIYKNKRINIPKNLLIIGTVASWYFGIVYFKGDITFTLLNVVSHGIPYYALVWAHGNKRAASDSFSGQAVFKKIFKPVNVYLFIGLLLLFAYIEEMIWDGFVWKEHLQVFPLSLKMGNITGSQALMSLFIPLLCLPQLIHYFIDGFIWKLKNDKFEWSAFLK